jgi:hypothetical protein
VHATSSGSSHGLPPALVDTYLYASDSLDFSRRYAVLAWKLSKAQHWLSLKRLDQAWVYVEAIRWDAAEMRRRIATELKVLQEHSSLRCGADGRGTKDSGEIAGLHAPLQDESTSALLSASHYLFFVLVEVCLLLSIVGCFYVATTYPHVFRPLVTRWVPKAILKRVDDSTRKHHA